MSSPSAIATVTATLKRFLDQETSATVVTTKSPGLARSGNSGSQLNLFLYSARVNPAFSNAPMPGQGRNGESAHPPLSLVLKYLLTSYGSNDEDVSGHTVLGECMAFFHDHPQLTRNDIEGNLPNSNLHGQISRLHITPDYIPLDDMSKLWTSFQSEYRLSTGYEVSAVLIESSRPARTPLPVLTRGEQDQGASVQSDLTPPFPTITEMELLNKQISAQAGDSVTLKGRHLAGDAVSLRLTHPRLNDPIILPAAAGSDAEKIIFKIPDPPAAGWLAGSYRVEAVVTEGDAERSANVVALHLAPTLQNIAKAADGSTLTLTYIPEVLEEQSVSLLLGSNEIRNPAAPAADTLVFALPDGLSGDYFVRLRVDGVDSLLVDRSAVLPVFLNAMKVTLP